MKAGIASTAPARRDAVLGQSAGAKSQSRAARRSTSACSTLSVVASGTARWSHRHGRRLLAAADAGRRDHAHVLGRQPSSCGSRASRSLRAGQLAGQAVAHAHRQRRAPCSSPRRISKW